VAYYKLDEGSGTSAADSSGNGFTGTLENNSTWVTGEYGGAVQFNGVNSDIVSSPSKTGRTAITIEGWVNFDDANNVNNVDRYNYLFGFPWEFYIRFRSYTDEPGAGYFLWLQGTTANGAIVNVDTLYNLPSKLAGWHHVAATYDGANAKIYLDGSPVVGQPIADSGIADFGRSFYVGGNPEFGNYFDGTIDDVRYYTASLSQSQIQQDMSGPANLTATLTASPTPTPTPTRTATLSVSPSLTSTALSGSTPTPTASLTQAASPTLTPTRIPTLLPTVTATATPTRAPTPTSTPKHGH
jgi:hypothetical protein